jgi:hypothetical protein
VGAQDPEELREWPDGMPHGVQPHTRQLVSDRT